MSYAEEIRTNAEKFAQEIHGVGGEGAIYRASVVIGYLMEHLEVEHKLRKKAEAKLANCTDATAKGFWK